MKRTVRHLERVAIRANLSDVVATNAATNAWSVRPREYRDLLRRKRESFWMAKIDAERSTPRQLWQSIDTLMGRRRALTSVAITADEMHKFFDSKVADVRASTCDAPPSSFSAALLGCVLRVFRPLTVADVVAAVRLLPDKQCNSNPLPTRVLKDNIDVLAPLLVKLFNRSLTLGVVPTAFKLDYITPLLKKVDLKFADARSYRPISNLSVEAVGASRLSAAYRLPQDFKAAA